MFDRIGKAGPHFVVTSRSLGGKAPRASLRITRAWARAVSVHLSPAFPSGPGVPR